MTIFSWVEAKAGTRAYSKLLLGRGQGRHQGLTTQPRALQPSSTHHPLQLFSTQHSSHTTVFVSIPQLHTITQQYAMPSTPVTLALARI